MTDDQCEAMCKLVGEQTIELYAKLCIRFPRYIAITGLLGGIAACATEAGIDRQACLAMINLAFDNIEAE